MKTTNLLVLALSLTFATAYAQSGDEQILNSAPINVDGYLSEPRPATDGELEQIRSELNKQKVSTQLNKEKAKDLGKLSQQTEKLLDSQDEYIDSKIESANAIKEFNSKHEENQKKLRCIMEESSASECDPYKNKYRKDKRQVEQAIQVQQAAPVVTSSAAIAPVALTGAPFETIKLIPYAGATSYSGEVEKLESQITAGLRLESNITERFSMGIGGTFGQLKTRDYGNGANYGMNGGYGGLGSMYNNLYGMGGREIQYRSMGIDLYGKFFITKGERFRPYIGAGLAYNRASLKYSDNNVMPYNNTGYNFGNEEYTTSYATGQLSAGTEIMVTQGFGLNIEVQYATALGSSLSNKSAMNMMTSPDQQRLRDLGKDIVDSSAISIFAGAVVNF